MSQAPLTGATPEAEGEERPSHIVESPTTVVSVDEPSRLVRIAPYVFGAVLSAGLVAPFMFRQNSWVEWGNAYWLLHEQEAHIRQTGLPTFFVSSESSGVDYPIFVFYGGFTLTLLGYLAAVTSTWFAFILSIVGAFAMGFVGMYWAVRAIGVGRLAASSLAAVAVCTPYFVTNLYGRGAWAELVGVGAAYLVLGATLRTLRELPNDRWTTVVAVIAGTALLVGTHNISLLVGSVFLAFALAALAPHVVGELRAPMLRRVALRLIVPGLVGVGLCAAWLVPNLWLSGDTEIASLPTAGGESPYDEASIVLWPALRTPPTARDFVAERLGAPVDVRVFNQTCSVLVLAGAVGLVGAWFGRRHDRTGNDRRIALRWLAVTVLVIAAVGTFAFMVNRDWWDASPILTRIVQFPMRLNPYLSGFLVLLVAVVAAMARSRRSRALVLGLLVVTGGWYTALAVYQSTTARAVASPETSVASRRAIDEGQLPPAFDERAYQTVQFRLSSLGASVQRPQEVLSFDQSGRLADDAVVETGSYATNVVWSPLVRAEGATIIGHDDQGLAVVRIDADDVGTQRPTIQAAYPRRVAAGIAVTLASLVALVVLLASGLLAVWRRRMVVRRDSATASALTGIGRDGHCEDDRPHEEKQSDRLEHPVPR
jgi:hypothetical protein